MHLFDVKFEEIDGQSARMLVVAHDAIEACELVTNEGRLVREVARRDGFLFAAEPIPRTC